MELEKAEVKDGNNERVSSIKDEGVDDMADLPPLGLQRGILFEYLSHVSEADLLLRGGLDEHLVSCVLIQGNRRPKTYH